MTEGSHRIQASLAVSWFEWFDQEGVPSHLPLEDQGAGVSELADMEEHSYHGPEGCTTSLKSWEGTEVAAAGEVSVSLDLVLTA